MTEFFNWVFDFKRPPWVLVLSFIVLFLGGFTLLFLSVAMVVFGYWLPPLLIWIILPVTLIFREYTRR